MIRVILFGQNIILSMQIIIIISYYNTVYNHVYVFFS